MQERGGRTGPIRVEPSRCPLAALVLAVAGCGAPESPGATTVVRDSADVTIVENGAPIWPKGEGWTVASTPRVEIGVLQGAPEYQLYRAYSAVRLSDGRIVVVNGGTNELRFYDASGHHLLNVGREGSGPGEFEQIRRVARLGGDTLVAWDPSTKRLSLIAPAGSFVRSARAAGIGGYFPQFHGVFADRSFVLADGFQPEFSAGTEISRPDVAYLRFGLDGALRDTLGPFPGGQQITVSGGSGDNRWLTMRALPFGRETYIAVQGDRFYMADSDRYEVAVYSAAGKLTALVRKHHQPLEVSGDDIERFKEDFLAPPEGEEPDENRQRMEERVLAEMPFPEAFPALADLHVDARGNLWVEEYRRPGDERPPVWSVFDEAGRLLGTVETPPDLDLLQIGDDFVLGRWQDQFDVDHIRLYDLIKPTARSASAP